MILVIKVQISYVFDHHSCKALLGSKPFIYVQVLRDCRGDVDVAIEYLIAEGSADNSSAGSYESDPDSSPATGTHSVSTNSFLWPQLQPQAL